MQASPNAQHEHDQMPHPKFCKRLLHESELPVHSGQAVHVGRVHLGAISHIHLLVIIKGGSFRLPDCFAACTAVATQWHLAFTVVPILDDLQPVWC